MRIIKLGLISVVVLFGIMTIIASFIPSHIRISRAVDINAESRMLVDPLQHTEEWARWNEPVQQFVNKKYGPGSIRSESMNVAVKSVSDTLIHAEWTQPSGRKFESSYRVIRHDSTLLTVQWYFDFQLKWYPWEKFQGIIYDGQIGPVMEKSLLNLKKQAESL